MTLLRNMALAAVALTVFGIVGSGLVALTHALTRDRILHNERQTLIRNLAELVPPERYDNDPLLDTLEASHTLLGDRQPHTFYRARAGGEPVVLFTQVVAPQGYGGDIELLLGVYPDGTLAGVRVLGHHETPGLGDEIELSKSDWILAFNGRSLRNPGAEGWQVRKDGGVFDQFTGATITPRAVVSAVHDFLLYFRDNKRELFAPTADSAGDQT